MPVTSGNHMCHQAIFHRCPEQRKVSRSWYILLDKSLDSGWYWEEDKPWVTWRKVISWKRLVCKSQQEALSRTFGLMFLLGGQRVRIRVQKLISKCFYSVTLTMLLKQNNCSNNAHSSIEGDKCIKIKRKISDSSIQMMKWCMHVC